MSGSGQQNNPDISGQGHPGQAGTNSGANDFNSLRFVISQVLATVRTATLVRVESCTKSSAVDTIGFLDATPLVNLVDGTFNTYKHGVVHNLCYSRVSGGSNAVICDPQPGDIGLAVMGDRDLSVVKNTLKEGAPGSGRRFALPDGIYVFPVLSKTAPTQYVRFVMDGTDPKGIEAVDALGNSIKTSDTGIDLTDKNGNTIVMDSDGVKINGVLFGQDRKQSNVVEVTADGGHTLTAHIHGGVQSGGSNTNTPTG